VSDSFGFDFGLVRICDTCDEILGFVSYVTPNSPASDAGLKRGDLFYTFNGTELTANNYTVVNGYYSDNSISMGFATLEDGIIIPNNKEVDLSLRVVMENPVFYSEIITSAQGKKIGYLVYNAFNYTYHGELNDVFGEFKSNNIEELILDLRYNGGGQGLTASFLASMIYGNASDEEIFAKIINNNKHSDENFYYPFFNNASIYNKEGEYTGQDVPINRLSNLNKLYVITSDDTASASELIINGLTPYMTVIKVGTTTYGKNVGSHTIYDSPDYTINGVNPNHTIALQPISSKAFNKLDQSDYTQGFTPDYEVIDYVSQMKDFGDKDETLLKATLDIIAGSVAKVSALEKPDIATEVIFKSVDKKPFSKELIVEPF
jgi:C-terminal processing protease CtpA/Prc